MLRLFVCKNRQIRKLNKRFLRSALSPTQRIELHMFHCYYFMFLLQSWTRNNEVFKMFFGGIIWIINIHITNIFIWNNYGKIHLFTEQNWSTPRTLLKNILKAPFVLLLFDLNFLAFPFTDIWSLSFYYSFSVNCNCN